ncbi:TonB-dependent receptor family protein [Agaribacter marinus]|uniref:TonB-dependent receptor n=1 Tax=Agaribacter marinus TaxID=1431249 RepID=A0AA37WJ60_9ALTE|nr:TonB-dependent receptor [Agaribacter marinus]GLR69919.1 TonB-dependent receptor [Agaribacter marinus]
MKKISPTLLAAAVASALFNTQSAIADDSANEHINDTAENIENTEHISIIGGQASLNKTAGSVARIDELALEAYEFDDIARVLATVPGVNIRQEDGFGLRPNIGFRGVTPERSKKINIMEDGILIGPAPYSAPAAYYFPIVSKMTAVEVTKGPSTIKYGPNTVAGALNLVTRSIPADAEGSLDLAFGTDGYYKAHTYYGSSVDKFGFLFEGITLGSAGFKDLDGGGDTGFEKNDLSAKFSYDLSSASNATQQYFELKLGYSDEISDETYLGLTDEDFAKTPNRRYAASQLDSIDWEHTQIQLTHVATNEDWEFTTRVYRHDFQRAWNKLDEFGSSFNGDIPSLQQILISPNSDENIGFYNVLTGQADSTAREILVLGNNDREFFSQGIQMSGSASAELFALEHTLNVGIRMHEDEIQRNHTQANYFMRAGQLVSTMEDRVSTTTNTEFTRAWSVFIEDTIEFDALTITAGIRGELIEGEYQNRAPGFEQDFQNKTTRIWLPSISAYYALNDNAGIFGGVHQGFVPTSPIQPESIEVEQSNNFEIGYRFVDNGNRAEVIAFFSDYSNLLESCSISAGCDTDTTFAAGDVDVYGLEALGAYTFELSNGLSLPITLSYTHTQSEFKQTFYSPFNQWGFVDVGNKVPYLAENMISMNAALQASKWDVSVLISYTDGMPESAQTALSGDIRDSTLAGVVTDDLFNIDLSAGYNLGSAGRMYAKVDNILDSNDIVSRRPFGARPSKPRQFVLGYRYSF